MSADIVLLNGNIVTMNKNQPLAEAIAVENDRIIQVGSNEAISNCIGKNTRIIHLHGRTVIPGIIDTHVHVADFGRMLSWLNLENVGSIKELQDCLRQKVKQTPKGKWIIGRGWDEKVLAERRPPTRLELDKISSENPVVLYHVSEQICLINSKAAKLGDIQTQSTRGVERDQTGEFTGVLRDNATNLVWSLIPSPDEEELIAASDSALKKIAQSGITTVHWLPLSPIEIQVVKKINLEKLPIRINIIAPASFFEEIAKLDDLKVNQRLKFTGFEIFADGYLASRTAALSEPYSDYPSQKGDLLCPAEELIITSSKIVSAGFQLVIHAVGDKAIDLALEIIKKLSDNKKGCLRYRIEQGAVLNQKLIDRLKDLHVVISVQPRVIASEFAVWSALQHLGSERSQWLFPIKSLMNAEVVVAGGSDCPMEPLNPLLGIQTAVTRENFEQKLSVQEALRMYTINAAYVSSEEKDKGSIEIGKLADLTVLSADPQTIAPDKIADISVEGTLVGGKTMFLKETKDFANKIS